MAYEEIAAYIDRQLRHLTALDRNYESVRDAALAGSVSRVYSTAGKNIESVGLNAFNPVPQGKLIGNVRRGRVLKKQPEDMAGKWEYDLDSQGGVLRARMHCAEWWPKRCYEDNLLVPSLEACERTYVTFSLREEIVTEDEYYQVFRFDSQGRVERRMSGRLRENALCYVLLDIFSWENERITFVDRYDVSPLQDDLIDPSEKNDSERTVQLLDQVVNVFYRRIPIAE